MKVVFDETKFIINEEKNIVTCVITAHMVSRSQQNKVNLNFWDEQILNKFTVSGVSKCHPGDKFSEETGKRIAESRAKRKVFSEGRERAKKLFHYTNIFLGDIKKMIDEMEDFRSKETEHIEKVMTIVEE